MSVCAQRIAQKPRRWLLSPVDLFQQPTNEYRLKTSQNDSLVLDFDYWRSILHGWFWIGLGHQRWNIISLGKGIYHIKCVTWGFYVGWDKEDFHDGAKVVMSKTPSRWAITSFSNGNYQFWAATSDKPLVPLGLGDLSGDALKLSSTPASWTVTKV